MPAKFVGDVVARWLVESGADRKMELIQPFAYVQASGVEWKVPKGEHIDGASIPQIAWTGFGSPYTGDYRRASVVHDHYCRVRTRSSADTHRMFAEASVTDGVDQITAGILYTAVLIGGGSWPAPTQEGVGAARAPIETITVIPEEDLEDTIDWIRKRKPSFDQIEKRLDKTAVKLKVPANSKLQSAEGGFR
jgi:hypothetical protein